MRLHRAPRRGLVIVAAGALVLAGGGAALAVRGDGAADYRTAVAAVGDVSSTLSLSGTVASDSRRDLTFGAAGSVASVGVTAGQHVDGGTVLASLDPTDLDAAVVRAEATLADAELAVTTVTTDQESTVAAAATTPSTRETTAAVDAALAELRSTQDTVRAGQSATTVALTAAAEALAAQAEACAVTEEVETVEEAAPEDPAAEPTLTCADALTAVQAAQTDVDGRQKELQTALASLADLLTRAAETLQSSTATRTDTSSTTSSSSAPSTSSPGGTAGGSGGATSLAEAQAAVDVAAADLAEARIARAAADLTAPFSGTVLSVAAEAGDDVAASDAVVVLVGDGTPTVTTTVTLDQVDQVEVGQAVTVTAAGADEAVTGSVSAIGLLPTEGSTSTTYPVAIALDAAIGAREGAAATVELVTGTVSDAVTVPTTAVTQVGDRSVVRVLSDGEVTATPVTLGVVGGVRTSVTEGLDEGDVVVLADLDAVLPTSETTSLTGRGGFGGGQMPAGGPPSGSFGDRR